MSNKREKEAGKERHSGGGGFGLPSNSASVGRLIRPGRLCETTTRKGCNTTVPCSINKNKNQDNISDAAKRTTKGGVSVNEPSKSKENTVSTGVWKARTRSPVQVSQATASVATNAAPPAKHAATKVTQDEARGGKERAQVTRNPIVETQPDPLAIDTKENIPSPQQVWREISKPESPNRKEARKQQLRLPIDNSVQSTQITNSSSHSSKSKKSKQVSNKKETLPRDQSSKGKQAQRKHAERKASTSRSYLESECYPEYHIEWKGFDEFDSRMGVCCCLCEEDLGVAPVEDEGEGEFSTFPVVAILPCGHTFHNYCLLFGGLEEEGEPPCVFCESFTS